MSPVKAMKPVYVLILFGLFFVSVGRSQRFHLDQGDEFFRRHLYREAIVEYKLALNEKMVINRYYVTKQIASTYRMLFDYEEAEQWYAELMKLGSENEPENYLHYAQLLANNQKYKEAGEMYAVYAQKIGKLDEVARYKELAAWAQVKRDTIKKMRVNVTNIETGTRSMGIWPQGGYLYHAAPGISDFTQRTAFYDLVRAKMIDSLNFDQPEKLSGSFNKSFYEGTPWVSDDGNTLYYTGNASTAVKYRNDKKATKAGLSPDGLNVLHIYVAKRSGQDWTTPVALNINGNFSCAFPCLSPDGKTLFFASNMPNGYGGFDVYKATFINDSTFGPAVNLGAEINTEFDEMYPFVNDTALFYSSRGLPGYGGADIFVCNKVGDAYSKPKNIGKPLNSSKDDFSLVLLPNAQGLMKGYFSSNRNSSHGYDQILYCWQYPPPPPPDTIQAVVKNRITGMPMRDVAITLERYLRDQVVPDSGGFSNAKGEVTFILKKNVAYRVTFRAEGFQLFVVEVPADDHYNAFAKFGFIELQPEVVKNTIVQIPNIYFDYDKATIRPESFPILEKIVEYLNENPTVRVELSAHTDSRGSDSYNLKLSDRRAKSVVDHLVSKGINKSRLVGKGYGETKLNNHCANGVQCTEEEHEVNRRVEMKVL